MGVRAPSPTFQVMYELSRSVLIQIFTPLGLLGCLLPGELISLPGVLGFLLTSFLTFNVYYKIPNKTNKLTLLLFLHWDGNCFIVVGHKN